ncbi:MAG: Na/Pi cotransporter family protein [Opitutales bacterium]|nr:Na/Pi cotransporter family protein [Opitutales bacterium]
MNTVFQIIGSLGVFLYGMKLMSDALQRLSGEKLRLIMRSMASNRFKGILSGTLVTSIIQSSSVTTVMVVSFVNAGLLTLREAIGVIMGANLGTTATAWIVAILGFKFSLSSIALPIVGVGMITTFCKKPGWRSTGEMMIGFGLLFMGLDFLKASVPDIGANPEALAWISHYSNMGFLSTLLFLVFGIILTLIVQSSSVAMAITVTMAAKGWISFEASAAIVLGENIGTTITALLASIPAGLTAKRAAITHTTFNVLGVVWMLVVFHWFTDLVCYLVPLNDAPTADTLKAMGITNFDTLTGTAKTMAMEQIALPSRVALFHSMFNLTNICILVWFVPVIEKIACWVLKGDAHKNQTSAQKVDYLAANIHEMGELALFEGQKELVKLSRISGDMFNGFVHVIQNPDKDLSSAVAKLRDMEEESDTLAVSLANFFVKCAAHDLSKNSIKIVTRNMIIVPELEEMCDSCYRLIKLARKRYRKQLFDAMLESEVFLDFCEQMNKFVQFADKSLDKSSISEEVLEDSVKMREKLDSLRKSLRKEAIRQMEATGVTKGGILFIEILSACERVNSHAMNILEAMNPRLI